MVQLKPLRESRFFLSLRTAGAFLFDNKARHYVEIMHGSTKERSEIDCKREIHDKNRLLKLRQKVRYDQAFDNVYNDNTLIGDEQPSNGRLDWLSQTGRTRQQPGERPCHYLE